MLRWCSGSSRNAVRHPSGASVQLRRNPQPGSVDGVSLLSTYEHLQPSCAEIRNLIGGAIDIGAYEFGGAGAPLSCALSIVQQ